MTTDFSQGLHPTQVQMYWDRCPKAFEYRYIDGLKEPPAAAQYQGTAYHAGLEHNFRHKLIAGDDLPLDEVEEVAAQRWDTLLRLEPPKLEEDEELGALKDQLVAMVRAYHTEIAPEIRPSQIEQQLTVEIADAYPLVGRIDLIDQDDLIIEHKTSRSRWTQDQADGNIQFAAYQYARHATYGHAPGGEFHIAVKLKRPAIQRLSVVKTPNQMSGYARIHRFVSDQIRRGEFPPRTDGWWCSERWCGYWHRCPYGAREARQFLATEEVIAL